MTKLSLVSINLLLIIMAVSAQNTAILNYNVTIDSALESCTQAFEKVSFKYRILADSSEIHVFYPPANRVYASLHFEDSGKGNTSLKISSFYSNNSDESEAKKNNFFYKVATQVADQGILGGDSKYAVPEFKSKNQNLYKGLCLVSPSIGMFYYLNSPINAKSTKYVIPSLLLGLDALGFYGVISDDIGMPDGSGRKSKVVGKVFGAILLGGMRVMCAFANSQGFEVMNNFSDSGYGLRYDLEF